MAIYFLDSFTGVWEGYPRGRREAHKVEPTQQDIWRYVGIRVQGSGLRSIGGYQEARM